MLHRMLFALTIVASLSLISGGVLAADPTLREVYQAAEAGNYRQAQSMMDQVLRDHPNSAKAHFVEAQLLAKEGRLSNARSELAIAERLEPGLPFANPGAVQKLKSYLASPSGGFGQLEPHALPSSTGAGFPWGILLLGLGLVGLIAFIANIYRRRTAYAGQQAGPASYGGAGPMQPYGAGGMGPVAPTGGVGSGILGGLATGAAVGAGVVAGEALMHRVLDGHRSEGAVVDGRNDVSDNAQSQYDMGGDDFGVSDTSSWDDSSGGGGSDWS